MCLIRPCDATELNLFSASFSEKAVACWQSMTSLISADDPFRNFALLFAITIFACWWDWVSTSTINSSKHRMLQNNFQKLKDGRCSKQKKKLNSVFTSHVSPSVVAFAARKCSTKRVKAAKLSHRRKTSQTRRRRMRFWLLGDPKTSKRSRKAQKAVYISALQSPYWMPRCQHSSPRENCTQTTYEHVYPLLWKCINMLEDQQSSQLQQASSITPQVLHKNTMQKQNLPHLRALLAGGAYGTHVTKRKRWGGGKATTAANDDYGLAQALANVLQQWQPNTIANAQTNKRFKKSQTKQSNLREQLLSVLTTNVQSSTDQEIVSKISHILQPYLGKNAGYEDLKDHEYHYDDTGQLSYYAHSNSSKQHHVNHTPQTGKQKTRWNKSGQVQKKHNASSPAIKGLIASEWTQVPKILESQELMRKIRAGESDDTTNIAPVHSIAEAKQLVSSWKAFGSQGGYTLLLTGPAKSMPGATPARIRVLRNNAIFKVEEVALFALGDANQDLDQTHHHGPTADATKNWQSHSENCSSWRIPSALHWRKRQATPDRRWSSTVEPWRESISTDRRKLGWKHIQQKAIAHWILKFTHQHGQIAGGKKWNSRNFRQHPG